MSTTERNPHPVLLTVAEAAQRLSVRPSTIRSWLSKGRLPRTKCGRCTRVPADAVEAFISANTKPSSHFPARHDAPA
jgi:excisionase family DNA binding protein